MLKRDFTVMNSWLHIYNVCLCTLVVAERILDCAGPLGVWNEPQYQPPTTLSSLSKKSRNSNYSCNLPTGQGRTGQGSLHTTGFSWKMEQRKSGTLPPTPFFLSLPPSLSLSIFPLPPQLLCPGPADTFYYLCSDALTHSLSHRVNRASSLSRLLVERVQHINTHKRAFLSLRMATASAHCRHVCAVSLSWCWVLYPHTHTHLSPDHILHCNKDSCTKYRLCKQKTDPADNITIAGISSFS